MARIKIPRYNRQVETIQQKTATTQVTQPLRQGYGEDVHNAVGNLGKAIQQIGQEFVRVQINNDKNKFLIAENNIKLSFKKKQLELEQANSIEEYDKLSKDYLENVQKDTKAFLGDRVNGIYEERFLKPMYESMKLDLEIGKTGLARKINLQDLDQLIDTSTNNIVSALSPEEILLQRDITINAIEMSPQDMVTKEKLINKANKKADVAQAYRMAELDPKNAVADLMSKDKYLSLSGEEKKALAPKLERIINTNEQTELYNSAMDKYRDDVTGKTDFQAAIKYVSGQKDYNPKNKNAVISMINGEFTKELNLARKEYNEQKQILLNNAYEVMLNNGDISGAIKDIQNSDVLLPTDKKAIIDKLTSVSNKKNKADNPFVKTDLTEKIVTGEINNENDILTAFLKGEITNTTKTALTRLLKVSQTPNQNILKNAIAQLKKSYNNGVLGTTPAEARGLSESILQVSNMYQEAVSKGKSTQEIQDLLSPENIQKIAETNRPTLDENVKEIQKQVTKKNDGNVLNIDIDVEQDDKNGDILGLGI